MASTPRRASNDTRDGPPRSMDFRQPRGRGTNLCGRHTAVRVPVHTACRRRRQTLGAAGQRVAHAIRAEYQCVLNHRIKEIQRKREIPRVQDSNHGAMGCDERLSSPCLRHCDAHLEASRKRFRIGTQRWPMAPASRRIFTDPCGAENARRGTCGLATRRIMRIRSDDRPCTGQGATTNPCKSHRNRPTSPSRSNAGRKRSSCATWPTRAATRFGSASATPPAIPRHHAVAGLLASADHRTSTSIAARRPAPDRRRTRGGAYRRPVVQPRLRGRVSFRTAVHWPSRPRSARASGRADASRATSDARTDPRPVRSDRPRTCRPPES